MPPSCCAGREKPTIVVGVGEPGFDSEPEKGSFRWVVRLVELKGYALNRLLPLPGRRSEWKGYSSFIEPSYLVGQFKIATLISKRVSPLLLSRAPPL